MKSSYLAVGYDCNHCCICCPLTTYDRLHKRLSYEEIKERVERLVEEGGMGHLVLSGGEPMLHPQFLDIVELASRVGFSITVLSNASACREDAFARELVRRAPEGRLDIVTAIHSSYPEVHDEITGVPGSLLDSLKGLDHLVRMGVPVTIKHILSKVSLRTLPETVRYLEQHFSPRVGFQFSTMDYSGRAAKNAGKLFVSMEEIQPVLEQTLDYLERHMSVERRIRILEAPLCMLDPYYWKYYTVSQGTIYGYIAPNADEKGVCFHVESECGPYFPVCKDCVVREVCPGTWRTAFEVCGDGLLRPVDACTE